MKVVLGSSSKWRQRMLKTFIKEEFEVMDPNIDEKAIRHPGFTVPALNDSNLIFLDPKILTQRIAKAKSEALFNKVSEPSYLITSDQVVVCNGVIREKPESEDECREFLRSYSQFPAECVCSVHICNTETGESYSGTAVSKQHFNNIPEEKINELIKQGDVLACAGGFTIEHMDSVKGNLEGEIETIQGLPKTLTRELFSKVKLDFAKRNFFKIGIYGAAVEPISKEHKELAHELGKTVAKNKKCCIVTGACNGIPLEGVLGAHSVNPNMEIIGFSSFQNLESHQQNEEPFENFSNLVFIDSNFEYLQNHSICRKVRNVASTAFVDAGYYFLYSDSVSMFAHC